MSAPIKTCKNCGREFMNSQDFLANTSRWRICDQGHLWFNCQCLSTGMIIKGRFDWYDPNSRLSDPAISVFNRLPQMSVIPHIPTYVMELQSMVEDKNNTSVQLASVTKRDPVLAAQILKVANSFALDTPIKSLAHAISFMGIEKFKDIILVAAISSISLKTKVFKPERFWEHSLLIGRCAEYLAKYIGPSFSADHAYIAGSTCNIGKIVMALCMPDLADRIAADLEDVRILGRWDQAEGRHGGHQHTVMGEIGAMFWGLPESICDVISLHHRMPPAQVTKNPELYEIIGLANQIAHWVSLQPHQMNQSLFKALCMRLQLSQKQAEGIIDEMLRLRVTAA